MLEIDSVLKLQNDIKSHYVGLALCGEREKFKNLSNPVLRCHLWFQDMSSPLQVSYKK